MFRTPIALKHTYFFPLKQKLIVSNKDIKGAAIDSTEMKNCFSEYYKNVLMRNDPSLVLSAQKNGTKGSEFSSKTFLIQTFSINQSSVKTPPVASLRTVYAARSGHFGGACYLRFFNKKASWKCSVDSCWGCTRAR